MVRLAGENQVKSSRTVGTERQSQGPPVIQLFPTGVATVHHLPPSHPDIHKSVTSDLLISNPVTTSEVLSIFIRLLTSGIETHQSSPSCPTYTFTQL